jgi:hypothetical protein
MLRDLACCSRQPEETQGLYCTPGRQLLTVNLSITLAKAGNFASDSQSRSFKRKGQ